MPDGGWFSLLPYSVIALDDCLTFSAPFPPTYGSSECFWVASESAAPSTLNTPFYTVSSQTWVWTCREGPDTSVLI